MAATLLHHTKFSTPQLQLDSCSLSKDTFWFKSCQHSFNKRGRPHREWSDDIEQWCGATLQELSHAALDRQRWAAIVTMASDTNGHWAHGCWWWWWWWCTTSGLSRSQFLKIQNSRLYRSGGNPAGKYRWWVFTSAWDDVMLAVSQHWTAAAEDPRGRPATDTVWVGRDSGMRKGWSGQGMETLPHVVESRGSSPAWWSVPTAVVTLHNLRMTTMTKK